MRGKGNKTRLRRKKRGGKKIEVIMINNVGKKGELFARIGRGERREGERGRIVI